MEITKKIFQILEAPDQGQEDHREYVRHALHLAVPGGEEDNP